MKSEIVIDLLTAERFDDFLFYLNDHISDNGKDNSPLFLPISRKDLSLSKEVKDSFRSGLSISIDNLGWRRVLIAVNKNGEIIGHIDLKSHNQNYTKHRAILGMGVQQDHRKVGVGCLLIESIIEWAKNKTLIERIDLWVLSTNGVAIRLYEKMGFKKVAEVEDMFRIDGASLDYIMMTKECSLMLSK